MPSLIDLRRRVRAVKNTQQITKAMKMVAASKLRRATERITAARPYAQQMQRVLGSVASRVGTAVHPLLTVRELGPDSKTLVIVVSADKGLCGSFNTNIIKAAGSYVLGSAQACALGLVGRKGREFFGRRGFTIAFDEIGIFQRLKYQDAQRIAQTANDVFFAAQMTAMETATKNSAEMIGSLTLYMNKVRQAAITREIIEVVSGAQAL